MSGPFGPLRYLYVGSKDTAKDLDYHVKVLGGTLVWDHKEFGAHVAAVRLGDGPLLLLADHRPPGSVIFIYAVADLKGTMERLKAAGWTSEGEPFELPDGPCVEFRDPTGNLLALIEPVRGAPLGMDSDHSPTPSRSRTRGQ